MFDLDALVAAEVLKEISLGVSEVAGALQQVYDLTAQAAADILKTIGFDAIGITEALKGVFNLEAQTAGEVLKAIEVATAKASEALIEIYSATTSQLVGILKDKFQASNDLAVAVLIGLGLDPGVIEEAILDSYDDTGDIFCGLFGC